MALSHSVLIAQACMSNMMSELKQNAVVGSRYGCLTLLLPYLLSRRDETEHVSSCSRNIENTDVSIFAELRRSFWSRRATGTYQFIRPISSTGMSGVTEGSDLDPAIANLDNISEADGPTGQILKNPLKAIFYMYFNVTQDRFGHVGYFPLI